ncbi:hypothetical protein [Novipirellula rosea]|uniref:Helix-turn-helix domain protein n=1 Tax=Novipirellula rosea TaxID=1031540 RepID=A0ABP8MTT6_9BACT
MNVLEYVFKPEALYAIDDVAGELGVSRARLDDEIRNGRIRIIRLGRVRLVLGHALLEWLAAAETSGGQKCKSVAASQKPRSYSDRSRTDCNDVASSAHVVEREGSVE